MSDRPVIRYKDAGVYCGQCLHRNSGPRWEAHLMNDEWSQTALVVGFGRSRRAARRDLVNKLEGKYV